MPSELRLGQWYCEGPKGWGVQPRKDRLGNKLQQLVGFAEVVC